MATPFGTEYGQKMTLTGPDGTVAVFNDPTDANYVGVLDPTQCGGLDSPDVRESADDLVQMDGGIHGDFFYSRRPVTLAGRIIGHASNTERNQRSDALKRATDALRPVPNGAGPGAAQGNARLTWTPSGGSPVYVDMRRQQPTRITGGWIKEFQLQMVAADPRVYSQALTSQTFYVPVGSGASGFSLTPPIGYNFGLSTPIASATLTNNGTTSTYPLYVLNGPMTNPVIYNATTGKAIAFAYTLAPTDGLVIDSLNRLIYLGQRATVTNLISNPSAEVVAMGGAGTAWTITRIAAGPGNPAGSWINQHSFTGTGGGDTNMGAFLYTVPSAGTYVMSGYIYMGSAYTGPLPFLTTDGSFTGGTTVTTVGADTTKRDQWQRIYTVFTVAAGDLTGSLVMRNPANPGSAGSVGNVYSDAWMVQAGSVPTNYGDGSFPGWSWSGAANASPSSGPSTDAVATANNRYGALDFNNTTWAPGLVPGANDVRLLTYASSPGAGMRVDYRDAWM